MNVGTSWWKRAVVGPVALSLVIAVTAPLSEAANTPLPSAPLPASGAQPQTNSTTPAPPPAQNATADAGPQQQGTAAAPAITPEGVPASRPAGAVIAPAKQRRVRIWAIRLGLIAGAAIALGTVIGATEASPRRP